MNKEEVKRLAAENRRLEKERRRLENKEAHRKSLVPAKKPIGTPVGNKERMQLFKDRLMKAEVGEGVIRKVIEIARDDEHPGQMAAIKMCMDRILPMSLFEDKKEGGRASIQITISGMGDQSNVIDVQPEEQGLEEVTTYSEVDDGES